MIKALKVSHLLYISINTAMAANRTLGLFLLRAATGSAPLCKRKTVYIASCCPTMSSKTATVPIRFDNPFGNRGARKSSVHHVRRSIEAHN